MALTSAQQKELNSYGALKSDGSVDFDRLNQVNGLSTPKPVATPKTTAAQSPQAPTFDMSAVTNQINNMYQSQLKAQQEALKRSQEQSLLSLNQRASDANLNYNQGINKINNNIADTRQNAVVSRNQQGAVNNQNVLKLREAMASMGLGQSGANAQNLSSLQNQHMANLNNITMQENKTIDDMNLQANDLSAQRANELTQIDEQIDLLKRQGVSQENELLQRLEAEKSAQLIDLMKYGDNRALQLYGMSMNQYNADRDYNYQLSRDSISDSRYNTEWNYQVGRDNIADQRYNTEWDYNVGRDNIADQRYNQEWTYNVGRDNIADQQWNKTFDYNKSRDAVADSQWNKTFNAEQAYQQQQLALARAKASSGGSSGGSSRSSSSGSSMNKTEAKNSLMLEMDNYIKNGEYERAKELLGKDREAIITTFGLPTYNQLEKMFWDSQAY